MIEWFQRITNKNRRTSSYAHAQKKYFSLMLIPSYTSGKTRSIRVSFTSLYVILFAFVVIVATMGFLHFQSRIFSQAALEASVSLEQTQVEYVNLRATVAQEENQLRGDITTLNIDIQYERARSQEELLQQEQDFHEELGIIRAYAAEELARLRQNEARRQELVAQLGESSHLPVVNNALNDMQQLQEYLLTPFNGLFESPVYEEVEEEKMEQQVSAQGATISLLAHSFNSSGSFDSIDDSRQLTTEEAARELVHHITTLELALEAQKELYSHLLEQVAIVAPHIRRDMYGPQLLNWSYVRNILPMNTPVMVTDVRTGTTFWITSFSHGNHADVYTVSAADTAALLRTRGGRWSWDTRPVWVHIGDRKVAASMNGMPHGGGGRSGNNMNGHVCIHFRGSRTHNGSWHHERDHQNSILEAYRADF